MRSIFVALTVLGLTCVVPAWTSAGSAAAQADKNDLRLFRTIQSAVLNYPHYTVFDSISASIDDGGIVTLSGKVTMPFKREEIERRVREIDGVRQVRNQIEVLPASKGDDELRLGIARAIYNNPTFQPYAKNRAATSSAVIGVPSWNLTPWRILNVQTLPSAFGFQLSASRGWSCSLLSDHDRNSAVCDMMPRTPSSATLIGAISVAGPGDMPSFSVPPARTVTSLPPASTAVPPPP